MTREAGGCRRKLRRMEYRIEEIERAQTYPGAVQMIGVVYQEISYA